LAGRIISEHAALGGGMRRPQRRKPVVFALYLFLGELDVFLRYRDIFVSHYFLERPGIAAVQDVILPEGMTEPVRAHLRRGDIGGFQILADNAVDA